MMTAPLVLVLVARHPVVKRHLAGQPALGQQLQGAIHGGEADAVVLLLDQAVQLVGGEMVAGVEEGAQYSVALAGMLQPTRLRWPWKIPSASRIISREMVGRSSMRFWSMSWPAIWYQHNTARADAGHVLCGA